MSQELAFPIECNLTYERDDEILQSRWHIATDTDAISNGWEPSWFNILSLVIEGNIQSVLREATSQDVTYRGLELRPLQADAQLNRSYRKGFQFSGSVESQALPANCPAVANFRAVRPNVGPVNGGLRLSIVPETGTQQGRFTEAYRQSFQAWLDTLIQPIQQPDSDNVWYLAIVSEKYPPIRVDSALPKPDTGSMIDRTGNRPQRKGKVPRNGT